MVLVGGRNSTLLVGSTSVTLSEDEKTPYVTLRGYSAGDLEYNGRAAEVRPPGSRRFAAINGLVWADFRWTRS